MARVKHDFAALEVLVFMLLFVVILGNAPRLSGTHPSMFNHFYSRSITAVNPATPRNEQPSGNDLCNK